MSVSCPKLITTNYVLIDDTGDNLWHLLKLKVKVNCFSDIFLYTQIGRNHRDQHKVEISRQASFAGRSGWDPNWIRLASNGTNIGELNCT